MQTYQHRLITKIIIKYLLEVNLGFQTNQNLISHFTSETTVVSSGKSTMFLGHVILGICRIILT